MTRIKVACFDGPRECLGHVVGSLAVHRGVGGSWKVTHLRTGFTVIGSAAGATYRQAMRIAKGCMDVDWRFGALGKKPRNTKVVQRARAAVFAAGLKAGLRARDSS